MNTDLLRYLQPRPRHSWRLWTIVVLLLALVGWIGFATYKESQDTDHIFARIDKLRVAQQKSIIPAPTPQEEADAKKWAELRIERGFDWELIFSAVERATRADIELLEFQPDKSSHTITLGGEAKNQKALVTFLTALASQPGFHNVHLTHQQAVVRDRLETVSFEIKANLKS
ncbi:MAG: PilN domain-containing protein [Pseudomonadota bacterium]